ncbi:hypothetical protein ONS95_003352 [Cadophora gregata]|uniref:uncharacterized protein n=1 Tax=Cadophora gregata TaxID=51156 RepID=UPI0026DCB718|nr:uncharacterized protein ONS95_003352 [Cadophora gregata]KAK0108554.1 hypothetical protein ONS95_003352 [Cadophora gregata]
MYPALPKGIAVDTGYTGPDRSVQEVFPPFKCVVGIDFIRREVGQRKEVLAGQVVVVDAIHIHDKLWRVKATSTSEDTALWVPAVYLRPCVDDESLVHVGNAPDLSHSNSVKHQINQAQIETRPRKAATKSDPQVQNTLDAVREMCLNTSDVVFTGDVLTIELRKKNDGTEYDLTTLPNTVNGWPVKYMRLSDKKEPAQKKPVKNPTIWAMSVPEDSIGGVIMPQSIFFRI